MRQEEASKANNEIRFLQSQRNALEDKITLMAKTIAEARDAMTREQSQKLLLQEQLESLEHERT